MSFDRFLCVEKGSAIRFYLLLPDSSNKLMLARTQKSTSKFRGKNNSKFAKNFIKERVACDRLQYAKHQTAIKLYLP